MRNSSGLVGVVFMLSIPLATAPAEADSTVPGKLASIRLTATPVPANDAERIQPLTTSSAIFTFEDGSSRTIPLRYQRIYRSGDTVGGDRVGEVMTGAGEPLLRSAPVGKDRRVAAGPFFGDGVDGSSLLQVPGAVTGGKANRLFLLTNFEYLSGAENAVAGAPEVDTRRKIPSSVGLGLLDQDPATGLLTPVSYQGVDFSHVGGIWTPCAATITPWNSHLSGEEYEPDALALEDKAFEAMNSYLGTPGKSMAEGGANPYVYGHAFEISVDAKGRALAAKRWAMGRTSLEFAEVMPDGRTVYLADDGKDVVRFMFIADKAGDLSSGRLYAARWEQISAENGGKGRLRWIPLGQATNEAVRRLIEQKITFSEIFERSPTSAKGFTAVDVYPGSEGKSGPIYVRVKPGRELAAAFLESRRYAALRGATTEFTKIEGQTVSVRRRKLYTSLAMLAGGMVDGHNGDRPADHIRLAGEPADLQCGAIYESNLRGGQRDTNGQRIDSDWVAADMSALVVGRRKPAGQQVGPYDACDSEYLANPDNIKYSDTLDTLFIEEDSDYHLNNFVWAYKPADASLVRLFSAPAGAENTGLQVVENYNGFAYITVGVSHPGAPHVMGEYPDALRASLGPIDRRGIVGYLGPLPAFTTR